MRLRVLLIIMCLTISMIPIGIIGGFQGFEFFTLFLIGLILIVTFLASYFMSYFITRPLSKITKNIDQVSKGNLDVALDKSEIYEINLLTQSLNRVMTSLKLAIHKVGVKKGEIFDEVIEAKEAAEEKYNDLLKSMDVWAWETDAKGVYIACSAKVADALGYTPEEIIGKTIFQFMPPEEAKKAKVVFTERSKSREPIEQWENYYLHKDGYQVYVYTNAVPVFDKDGNFNGYRGIHRDITTSRKSQDIIDDLIEKNKRLKEMREKTRILVDEPTEVKRKQPEIEKELIVNQSENDIDAMFLFDEHANVVDCNNTMLELLGYTKPEMLTLTIADIDVLETKGSVREKINEIKKLGSMHLRTIHKRKDGSSIFVHGQINYLKDEKRFKCIVKEDSL